ncbi:EboA domain-containing protein [Ulvibacterium sp.]|uniref:EboA domain-containing protein n=1 Tax=Ulvibacterium sp. TaxID=2665914 RepID=UPI002638CB47|nr:EboA domain-containing protein [Ulvibacterium sp.]
MQLNDVGEKLSRIIGNTIDAEAHDWLEEKIRKIIREGSARDMYMTYSLIPSKVYLQDIQSMGYGNDLEDYLRVQKANIQQISRIHLLISVLNADMEFFTPKVANIIQVADTGELETFLKFLILLPNPEAYKTQAVEALRTNVSTVFNAISLNNPYPALFFDEQQWNQMYLKTAFMQGDLSAILDIDKRANKELARIISDYAHERWAASRDIDPYFWRPVSGFLNNGLLTDMERLLESANCMENRAGALCCYHSDKPEAKKLLAGYPGLQEQITNKILSWKTLKD